MSAQYKNNVAMLGHQLVPHIVAVIHTTGSGGRNDIAAIYRRSITEQVGVGGNDNIVIGMRLDNAACPTQHCVIRTVIQSQHQILHFAHLEGSPGVGDVSVRIEAFKLCLIGIGTHIRRVSIGGNSTAKAGQIMIAANRGVRNSCCTQLCMLGLRQSPLGCIVVIGDITQTEYILDILAALVGNDPIEQLSKIVFAILHVVFRNDLDIRNHRKGICVIRNRGLIREETAIVNLDILGNGEGDLHAHSRIIIMSEVYGYGRIRANIVGEVISLDHNTIQVEIELRLVANHTEIQTAGISGIHFLFRDHIVLDHGSVGDEVRSFPAQQCTGSGLDSVLATCFDNTERNCFTVIKNKLHIGSGIFRLIAVGVISDYQRQIHIGKLLAELQGLCCCAAAIGKHHNTVVLSGDVPESLVIVVLEDGRMELHFHLDGLCAKIQDILRNTVCVSGNIFSNILFIDQNLIDDVFRAVGCHSQDDLFTREMDLAGLGSSDIVDIVVDLVDSNRTRLVSGNGNIHRCYIGANGEGNLHTVCPQIIVMPQIDEHLGVRGDAAGNITGRFCALGQIAECHLSVLYEDINRSAVTDHT